MATIEEQLKILNTKVDEARGKGYSDTEILDKLSKNNSVLAQKILASRNRYNVDSNIKNDRDLINYMSKIYSGQEPTVASVDKRNILEKKEYFAKEDPLANVRTNNTQQQQSQQTENKSVWGNVWNGANDIAQGVNKGVAESFLGIASIPQWTGKKVAEKITGKEAPEQFKTVREIADETGGLETENTAESIGKGAEQLAEFFVPGGIASKATKTKNITKILSKSGLENILKRGAIEGAGTATIEAGQEGEINKEVATSGILGFGGGAVSEALLLNKINKAKEKAENLVQQITRGNKEQVAEAKEALGTLDTSGIKTYNDLIKTNQAEIKTLARKQDQILSQYVDNVSVDSLTKKIGSREQNYVKKAFNDLKEFYDKTDDLNKLAEIETLEKKALSEGITVQEINNLARKYTSDMPSAFSKITGEPLTSVNKIAMENTRTGLKDISRGLMDDDAVKILDEQMSNLYALGETAQKMSEGVYKLEGTVKKRGLIEKIGKGTGRALDHLTGGSVRGFLTGFLPSNIGNKTMNYLDAEKALAQNLKKLEYINKNADKMPDDRLVRAIIDLTYGYNNNEDLKNIFNN